jgi:predicted transcriptional regulator of viral defense system
MTTIDRRIAKLADRQHGVVARWQLLALGLSSSAIERRIAGGLLVSVYRGVYLVARTKLSPRGHWMAAVLSCGPAAVLSHRSALMLHGVMLIGGGKIDVTIEATGRVQRGKLRIHTSMLDAEDIAGVDGIPVTSVARALLDSATALDDDRLLRVIEEAERRDLFDLRAVERVLARRAHVPGTRRLKRVLAAYRGPAPTRSELERLFLELVRRAGIPLPLVNTIVAGLEVDFYWPDARLVVELDGARTTRALARSRRTGSGTPACSAKASASCGSPTSA